MSTDTVMAPQVPPKHIRLRLGGKDVNLVVYPKGIKPPELILVGTTPHEEAISGIEVYPSTIDPRRIMIKWPSDPSLRYMLVITDSDGQPVYESQTTNADRLSVPLADIEGYIGKRVYAVLLCFNPETKSQEIGLDKWFIVPKPNASVVLNYDEAKELWVAKRRRRRLRILDRTFLILLYVAVFAGLYYLAFKYR